MNIENGQEVKVLSNEESISANELLWEESHTKICTAIGRCFKAGNYMPTVTELAKATGLNRKTIRKHLDSAELFTSSEGYRIMQKATANVAGSVVHGALMGDVKAAKLFFEVVGIMGKSKEVSGGNYIQINNTTINQQVLQQLKPELLAQIEQLIVQSLPAKEQ